MKKDLLIFALIFGLLTLPFWFFDIDIAMQKPYFDAALGWFLMDKPFWDFIYKYGIFLGYLLAVAALVTVSVSYWNKRVAKWRKASYFMLFVMIIGPGVLVNATFKDHWGRPRPREIKEFGGKQEFLNVWVKGDSGGKSFPCGHASMGFYIAIPFLFLRKHYKKMAWAFLIFGTLYGLLIGYARLIAGGHFASDTLWAAGMVWFTAILGYYLLKMDKPPTEVDLNDARQRRKARLVTILMGMVLPILTVGLLLATPYISTQKLSKSSAELLQAQTRQLNATFNEGSITVGFTDAFNVNYTVNAFGFPNSKVRWRWNEGEMSEFWLENMGWFTELRNNIELNYPEGNQTVNILTVIDGEVYFTVPADTIPNNLTVDLNSGNLTLVTGGLTQFNLKVTGGEVQNKISRPVDAYNNGPLHLTVILGDDAILTLTER